MDAVPIALWEWPGEGTPLVLAHATGFHGRIWDYIVTRLPGRHIFAVETRGHGRSGKPAPPYHWRDFGSDLAGAVRALGIQGATAVGHSSGGYAVILAAALAPEIFSKLLAIDPTIFPAERYSQAPLDASFTLRRKNHWHSIDEMIERFRGRAPFAGWNPEILRDYCRFGLQREGDHLVLACPPPVEASIYAQSNAPETNIYELVPSIAQPVTVLRAGHERRPGVFDLAASPTAPDLASKFQQGRDVVLPGRSHYIPMEVPERVLEEIVELG